MHIHNVQEEDIYEHAAAQLGKEARSHENGKPSAIGKRDATAFERALRAAPKGGWQWRILAGALVIVAFAGGGVYWGGKYYARVRYGAPLVERASTAVTVAAVISATTATPIEAKTSGVIEAVYCDVGSVVKTGQLCAKIDARPYQVIIERSKAALELGNGGLEKAKAQLARALAIYDRNQNLAKRGAVTAKALQVSRKAAERRKAQVVREEASVTLANAALRAADNNLEHTNIFSPTNGTVVSRAADVGREVIIGKTEPLFVLAADLSVVKITLRVDEEVADAVRPGDKVSFSVDVLPDRLFHGEVAQISQAPRTIDGGANYDVVITASNPDFLLEPDMSTTIRMAIGWCRPDRQRARANASCRRS